MPTTTTSAGEQPKGHRGPRRLAIGAFLMTAAGGGAAAASAVEAARSDGLLATLAGNTVGLLFNLDSSGDSNASFFLAFVFVVGLVAATLGLALLLIAALWSIARVPVRHHAAASWDKAEPTVNALGQRGRDGLSAATEHGAPALRAGSRRVAALLPRRGETAPTRLPGPAAGGTTMTPGDPLEASAVVESDVTS